MRVPRWISLVACCLPLALLSGCGVLGKKAVAPGATPRGSLASSLPSAPTNRSRGEPSAAPVNNGGGQGPLTAQPASASSAFTGLLAGQVLGTLSGQPPRAFIQISAAAAAGLPPVPPSEVETDANGYFTIERLQAGRSYQLVARAKVGDRMMAGSTWATPPNPRVLIQLSEEFATQSTPPVPTAPPFIGPETRTPHPAPAAPKPTAPATVAGGWGPGVKQESEAPAAQPRASDLGSPVKVESGLVQPGTTPATAPTNPLPANARLDKVLDIPNPYSQPGTVPAQANAAPVGPIPGPAPTLPEPPGKTPVPSCVLTGRQLYNFALYDLEGRPWEYRQHRGRLVLLDFWGSWCKPCLRAIPHLNILQQQYGPYGLEVVGIAYEEEGSPQEQAQQVNRVRQRLRINYRVLLGGDREQCPVRKQFDVRSYPTVVLIDEAGQIVARYEGLRPEDLRDLEVQIRQRLFAEAKR